MKHPKLRWWLLAGVTLLIAGLDQLTKYLTVTCIPAGSAVSVIPGVVGLTYVRNTGAAWSMFSGSGVMRWVFVALVAVFLAAVVYLIKKGILKKPFELWCVAAIAGGAVGNAIDRAVFGSVCDMIRTEFIDFPVFNVADSFITVGAILLAVCMLFFGREKPDAAAGGN